MSSLIPKHTEEGNWAGYPNPPNLQNVCDIGNTTDTDITIQDGAKLELENPAGNESAQLYRTDHLNLTHTDSGPRTMFLDCNSSIVLPSSAAADPVNGSIYYDTTRNSFRFRENGIWRGLGL